MFVNDLSAYGQHKMEAEQFCKKWYPYADSQRYPSHEEEKKSSQCHSSVTWIFLENYNHVAFALVSTRVTTNNHG